MCSFSGETDYVKYLSFEMLGEVVTDGLCCGAQSHVEPNLNVGFLEDKFPALE